mmetsp:Transcript_13689/g.16650  ORF Transcript_13689/g.16650 Transcript_13689/m.16650 type:complete len:231 (+) Transcript_13689:109-801(+)
MNNNRARRAGTDSLDDRQRIKRSWKECQYSNVTDCSSYNIMFGGDSRHLKDAPSNRKYKRRCSISKASPPDYMFFADTSSLVPKTHSLRDNNNDTSIKTCQASIRQQVERYERQQGVKRSRQPLNDVLLSTDEGNMDISIFSSSQESLNKNIFISCMRMDLPDLTSERCFRSAKARRRYSPLHTTPFEMFGIPCIPEDDTISCDTDVSTDDGILSINMLMNKFNDHNISK